MENKDQNILDGAIVRTVAYFDIFDYPLTEVEIYRFLFGHTEDGCARKINQSLAKGLPGIEEKKGFYFLPGRAEIINTREERAGWSERKFALARRVAFLFRLIPWIRFVGVANIMGQKNLREDGDIDFFIITEAKKIWLTRFFANVITQLLGLRPKPQDVRDKICLSFFVSEDALNLEKLMLPGDIYFIYWLVGLEPVYQAGGIYGRLLAANLWIKKYLPNWHPQLLPEDRKKSRLYHGIIDFFLGSSEAFFKKIQLRLMPEEIRREANRSTNVIINDEVLKFHTNDRRQLFKDRWNKKIKDETAQ